MHVPYDISWEEQNPMNFTSSSITHYTTIGMPIDAVNVEEHRKSLQAFAASPQWLIIQNISIPNINESDCRYILYESDSTGGQLWGALQNDNSFGGFIPHFRGKSRIKMTIIASRPEFVTSDFDNIFWEGDLLGVPDRDGGALEFLLESDYSEKDGLPTEEVMIMDESDHDEANFIGYGFGGDPDRTETAIFFPFACPNFGCFYHRYLPPARVTIQLAGLAESVTTFDSIEEYELYKKMERQQEDDDVLFSSQFFGTGPLLKSDEGRKTTTHAWLVGHIVETELRVSKLTGQSFYWALVKTGAGMEIDVVIHPGLLKQSSSEPPIVGGVFEGYCYLSGLLIEEDDSKD